MPFFEQSQGTVVTGGTFIEHIHAPQSTKGSGVKLLLESSLPQAIHNSYDRDPPKCHPGTREEYIRDITGWGSGAWKTRKARALWMRGPAGVGKSAVAQTSAEDIESSERLGATFFFYRPNGWNDPKKFIPTIAYQLATRYPAYRDLVDAIVLCDPLVVETSVNVQFRELLVKPLRELTANGQGVGLDAIIIIDGLDECKTVTAQSAIIELVTTSIHEQTTPFLWAFFSRPEPHIAAAFSSELAKKVSWQLTLPVSRDADSDIEAYLRDGFKKILAKCGLPPDTHWPSDEDIRHLVDQSSGLFIYAATAIRYIGQDTGVGHEAQLRMVLELGQKNVGSASNPLSKLDQFYILIMRQVPEAVLPNTLSLLGLHLTSPDHVLCHCSALGLSLTAFYAATSNLHSVLEIEKFQQGIPTRFSFYHASFTDFLSDPTRSGPEFCANTPDVHQRCLTTLANTLYRVSISDASILSWPDPDVDVERAGGITVWLLFCFAAHRDVHLGKDILRQLSQFNWTKWQTDYYFSSGEVDEFFLKIPWMWRSKIIRPFYGGPLNIARQTISNIKQGRSRPGHEPRKTYIVGTGSNKALLVPAEKYTYHLMPYPDRM